MHPKIKNGTPIEIGVLVDYGLCIDNLVRRTQLLEHYAFVLVALALISYITFNLAKTAKYTDSTVNRVESIVTIIKQK